VPIEQDAQLKDETTLAKVSFDPSGHQQGGPFAVQVLGMMMMVMVMVMVMQLVIASRTKMDVESGRERKDKRKIANFLLDDPHRKDKKMLRNQSRMKCKRKRKQKTMKQSICERKSM
jgi:hypothetical protein